MRCLTEIDLWTGYVITQVTMTAAKKGKAKIYRIPAPVTPPDPAQHQFIRVDGKDYKAIPESGRYQLLEAGLETVHVINREDITEWTELELVPKEVADND